MSFILTDELCSYDQKEHDWSIVYYSTGVHGALGAGFECDKCKKIAVTYIVKEKETSFSQEVGGEKIYTAQAEPINIKADVKGDIKKLDKFIVDSDKSLKRMSESLQNTEEWKIN